MRFVRRVVSVGTAAAAVYAFFVRPRLIRWGATEDEVHSDYPGADVVQNGVRAATMAVTIDAPPAEVWPWLIRMGYDHAGWYSWDRLDNGGRPSATELRPEWQQLTTGDYMKAWSPDGPVDAWQVAVLEPKRFLGLRGLSDLRGHVLDPALPRPAGDGVIHSRVVVVVR
jgi:proline iminopeptidase